MNRRSGEEPDVPSMEERGAMGEFPAHPLMNALAEMGEHLSLVDDGEYAAIPSHLFTSSPGAQVRHTLDHVNALLHGVESGVMEYDIRERGGIVENSREAAREMIASQLDGLRKIGKEDLKRAVVARLLLDPGGEILEHASSISREIAFVLSHTIHHNAILVSMFRYLGKETTGGFGYAPATLAYRQSFP